MKRFAFVIEGNKHINSYNLLDYNSKFYMGVSYRFDTVLISNQDLIVNLKGKWASLVAQLVRNPPAMRETWVRSLDWEGLLEKGIVTHSSILAWRIPWTVQEVSKRVRHD